MCNAWRHCLQPLQLEPSGPWAACFAATKRGASTLLCTAASLMHQCLVGTQPLAVVEYQHDIDATVWQVKCFWSAKAKWPLGSLRSMPTQHHTG